METLLQSPPTTEQSVSNASSGSIMNVDASADLFFILKAQDGIKEASKKAKKVYKKDLQWMAWEASGMVLPKSYDWHIERGEEGIKVVHESDLHWKRDVMEGVSPHFRRGLEWQATKMLRQAMIDGQVGDSWLMVSPKRDANTPEDTDCPYTDTQISYAEKISQDVIRVNLHQRKKLDTIGAARLLNSFSRESIVAEGVGLNITATTIASRKGAVSTDEMFDLIANAGGEEITKKQIEKDTRLKAVIEENSDFAANDLLRFIRRGDRGTYLKREYGYLLAETLGEYTYTAIETRCGGLFEDFNYRGFDWQPSFLRKGLKCEGLLCREVNVCYDRNEPKCWKCDKSLSKFSFLAA